MYGLIYSSSRTCSSNVQVVAFLKETQEVAAETALEVPIILSLSLSVSLCIAVLSVISHSSLLLQMDEETKRLSRLPASQWEAAVMRRHAEVLELRERLRAVAKGATESYARTYYTREGAPRILYLMSHPSQSMCFFPSLAQACHYVIILSYMHALTYSLFAVQEADSSGQTRTVQEVQYPPRTDNREALSHHQVLQLIMGHLAACGRMKTLRAIEEESGVACAYLSLLNTLPLRCYAMYILLLYPLDMAEEDSSATDTRLRALLRIAMRRVKKNDLFAPQLSLTDKEKNGTPLSLSL